MDIRRYLDKFIDTRSFSDNQLKELIKGFMGLPQVAELVLTEGECSE